MQINKNIRYIGVNDHKIDLFEGQYVVANGMSYNSYVILDEKIAVMDTVEARFTDEWLDNLSSVLGERVPDYLVIHHMEPDHSANIVNFINAYPNAKIVASSKALAIMENFFGGIDENKKISVRNKEKLSLGLHELNFIYAPMIHWPEVMFSYESTRGILFSADAFGKFGALDVDDNWDDEARRYYFGIVGKYGVQVQAALKNLASLPIKAICPLHGPILNENIKHYVALYDKWSSYQHEDKGIVIAYTSMYGNTKRAALTLAKMLEDMSTSPIITLDLARTDWSEAIATAFRYDKLVLATTTYNSDIFPAMRQFIEHLVARNYKNRTLGFIENGSWAPMANKHMRSLFDACKNMTYLNTSCTVRSALNNDSIAQLQSMADELCKGL